MIVLVLFILNKLVHPKNWLCPVQDMVIYYYYLSIFNNCYAKSNYIVDANTKSLVIFSPCFRVSSSHCFMSINLLSLSLYTLVIRLSLIIVFVSIIPFLIKFTILTFNPKSIFIDVWIIQLLILHSSMQSKY